MSDIRIEEVTEVTSDLSEALHRLIPQLSSSWTGISDEELLNVALDQATCLLVARDGNDRIIGTLTLATFSIPTGTRSWIEDVVVDVDARGLGAAKALVAAALNQAAALGAKTVDLTSRPTREAANALYLAMGFTERVTNVYRFSLEG